MNGEPTDPKRPRLGVVLLAQAHAQAVTSEDPARPDEVPPWSYTLANAWSMPWRASIADGAGSEATLAQEPAALDGVRKATERLAADADLIVGNCGFFWAPRERVRNSRGTPVLLSALDLLDFALDATSGEVGVVTFSQVALDPMLEQHPGRSRLRVLGLSHLPQWSALADDNYLSEGGWSVEGLRQELREHLAGALEPDGQLAGVSVLVLECTILSYYRTALREVTTLPMLDVASIAEALLR